MKKLSKKSFCKLIKFIEEKRDAEHNFNDALEQLDHDFYISCFLYSQYESIIIDALEEMFETSAISYFVYDSDFGKKADTYYTIDEDGTERHIYTSEQLYDYITKEEK